MRLFCRGGRLAVAALLACAILTVSTAAARPIDLAGRFVPFKTDSAGLVKDAGGRCALASMAPDLLSLTVQLDPAQTRGSYALLVPGTEEAEVHINGRRLDVDPLHRHEGLLYRVTEMYLRAGSNTISISRPASASPDWDGAMLFSLDGTLEEVHFARAFSDAEPNVQPPADAEQPKFDVLSYDCLWQPDMTASVLTSATVAVRARSLDSSLQTVVLDYNSNYRSSTGIHRLPVSRVDSGPGTAALPFTIDTVNKRLRITMPATIPAGTEFVVRVGYSGTPNSNGAFGPPYVRSTHNSIPVVYTFSEPYGARQWWPCKDLPDDKPDSMTIRVVIPSGAGYQVVTNGSLTGVTNNGDGTETWNWQHNFPIATYLVSMCVSNYIYVSSTYTALDGVTTMNIKHAIYPENIGVEGSAAIGTLQVMNFFRDTFGEYPFLTDKYYTASHNSGSGMEHQTCTSMPGGDVQDGMQRRNVHELAHMWYGDKITCRHFDHLWLNEGFATYAEALWTEFRFGLAAYHAYVDAWSVSTTTPVISADADDFAGTVVYRKGAWVLHMLRHVVGDAAFFDILRAWAAHPTLSYGTALTPDLQDICEQISGKDLDAFFYQWLYRPDGTTVAEPVYWVTGSAAAPGGGNVLSLRIEQIHTGNPFVMPVDIRLKDATGATSMAVVQNTVKSQTFGIATGSFQPVELDLDPDNWILKDTALSINTCGLSNARVGTPYSRTFRASYGSGSYTWSTPDTMPPGLSLSPAGVLSGTPTTPGVYPNLTFRVSDGTSICSVDLHLAVAAVAAVVDDDTLDNDDSLPPGSATGWSQLGVTTGDASLNTGDHDPAVGAYRVRVHSNATRFHLTGWADNRLNWLPYATVGSANYVRGKFYMYAQPPDGQPAFDNPTQIPNFQLRLATRFAVTANLLVYHHNTQDTANEVNSRELRPSTDPAAPSVYRLDFDPVDVPYLSTGTTGEGIMSGFDVFTLEPHDNGFLGMTERVLCIYPASLLQDSAALQTRIYAPSAGDAGGLRIFDSATDLRVFNYVPGPSGSPAGTPAQTETAGTLGVYSESETGVTMDTSGVASDRIGFIERSFFAGASDGSPDYANRMRIEPARQYKVRWHVTSTQSTALQSWLWLQQRSVRFAWQQSLQLSGAWGANGPASQAVSRQSIPGVGCANPDTRTPGETGGYYTVICNTPLDPGIRPEFPASTPVATRMPNIASEPGPGLNAPSIRDLKLAAQVYDTISSGDGRADEAGSFTIDRIEVRSYLQVED